MTKISQQNLTALLGLLDAQGTKDTDHLRVKNEKNSSGDKVHQLYAKDTKAKTWGVFKGNRAAKFSRAKVFVTAALKKAGVSDEQIATILRNAKGDYKGSAVIEVGKLKAEIKQLQQGYQDRLGALKVKADALGGVGNSDGRRQLMLQIENKIGGNDFNDVDRLLSQLERLVAKDKQAAIQYGKQNCSRQFQQKVARFHGHPRMKVGAQHARMAATMSKQVFQDSDMATIPMLKGMSQGVTDAYGFGNTIHGRHMVRQLENLCQDDQCLATLNSIKAPKEDNPMCDVIRTTLGLGPEHKVTDADARAAALSALLCELRQSDVGSCFGTAIAIDIHDEKPTQFLKQMKEMIETGRLTQRAGDAPKSVAAQTEMSLGKVDQMINLSLKHEPGEGALRVYTALEKWMNNPNNDTVALEHALKSMGIDQTAFLFAAAQSVDNAGGDQTMLVLSNVLDYAVRNKHQIEPQDVALHSAMKEKEARLNSLEAVYGNMYRNVNSPNDIASDDMFRGDVLEMLKAREELATLKQKFSKIEQKWGDYQKSLGQVTKHMIGHGDNPMMRSFEYTISAFAETGDHSNLGPRINDSIRDSVVDFVDNTVKNDHAFMGMAAQNVRNDKGSFKTQFKQALKNQLESRLKLDYDPNIQRLGQDGKGGFHLVNTHGSPSSKDWTTINSEKEYDLMIRSMVASALDEIGQGVENPQDIADLKEGLMKALMKNANGLRETILSAMKKSHVRTNNQWDVRQGHNGFNVLSNFHGADYERRSMRCYSGDDILNLITAAITEQDSDLQKQANSNDSKPIRAIAARPGHQYRLRIPKTKEFQAFWQLKKELGSNVTNGQIASMCDIKDGHIFEYGDSNHGVGDKRKFYGLQYKNGSFRPVTFRRQGDIKTNIHSDKDKLPGDFEILNKKPEPSLI